MASLSWDRARTLALVGLFLAAAVLAFELLRPLHAASVGFDSAASVVYFDRIVTGRHLEAFVTATPKPVLTLLYGGLMAITHDWRSIAWSVILAFAACIPLGALFVGRYTGAVGATAAAVVLLTSPRLVGDVAIAYALPWALLLWLVAGLALSGPQPRPAIAGLALGGATLARLETLAMVGVILSVTVVAGLLDRRRGRPVDRSWWWLGLALLALPVMLIHDALLTGDPFFWLSVSAEYSSLNPSAVLSPGVLIEVMTGRYLGMPILLLFAIAGLGWLARRRAFVPFWGLVAMSLGVGVFLVTLAARGTYVSDRYFGAIDLGVGLAAAVGAGAVVPVLSTLFPQAAVRSPDISAADRPPTLREALSTIEPRRAIAAVVAVALVVVAIWPPPSLNHVTRSIVRNELLEARHADQVLALLNCAIAAIPGGLATPPPTTSLAPTTLDDVRVFVPVLLRPRLAHDLGVPLGAIAGSAAALAHPANALLPSGFVVLHDMRSDRPREAFADLEVERPTTVGGVLLTPLLADPRDGVWVDWIGRPGGPAAPTHCPR